MEVNLKEELLGPEIGSSVESVQKLLDSQSKLFHSQINHLQNIVVTQCKLTGVNPLSQEMAAGALSIKIGKRPRDLLNPKAVKYMQSVFSIKDSISKKESREISAQFGVTVTQVRDFIASQRTKVRKIVRLSREKAIKSNVCNVQLDGVPTDSDPMIPIDQVPLNSVGPTSAETPSCSTQDEALQGIDDSDMHFVQSIFSLMRKEETFAGQVKLMEWILRIQNPAVLQWFLTKGGVMILATWLSEAAGEEQTSILLAILKVLCHLPLHKALPVHMSAILQSVNRLRFYRASDISNRARVLLAKWSKMFARSQALKKPNGTKSSYNGQKEITLKRSFDEIIGDESWQSNLDISEEILAASYESSENYRKLESPQTLKLLPAPADETNRKNILGVSSSQNRERRKVQLVEQPQQKSAGRSPQATRPVKATQGRPMSADDIQKAKMRAQFMQSKYGKISSSSNDTQKAKMENTTKSSTTQPNIVPPVSKPNIQPKIEEQKKPVTLPSKVLKQVEAPPSLKDILDPNESPWEKVKRVQIQWQTPPEMELHNLWRVGEGDNSKEVEVQKNRNRREKETVYLTITEIPLNPKEPWDVEMDYDDSLTTEIPTEQLPDAETQVVPDEAQRVVLDEVSVSAAPVTASEVGNASSAAPDLELLAVLLKNPELVFALTSGQAGNLSSEDTIKLLDMIKAGGASLPNGKVEEKTEVSLPSPTPSINPQTSGWKQEVGRNPFSREAAMPSSIPALEKQHATYIVQPQVTLQQHPTSVSPLHHQLPFYSTHHQSISANTSFPQTSALDRYGNPLPSAGMNLLHHESLNITRASKQERSPILHQIPEYSRTMHPQTQLQQQLHTTSYPTRPSAGNPGPDSDYWRARQVQAQNPRFQADQNAFIGQPPLQHWERNEYGGGGGGRNEFESWSPDNSPRRSQMLGREPRMNYDRDYRSGRSRDRNSFDHRDNNSRYENRRWK